jgi:hypothetical protein
MGDPCTLLTYDLKEGFVCEEGDERTFDDTFDDAVNPILCTYHLCNKKTLFYGGGGEEENQAPYN